MLGEAEEYKTMQTVGGWVGLEGSGVVCVWDGWACISRGWVRVDRVAGWVEE